MPGIDRAQPLVTLFAFERACARAEVGMERWRASQAFMKQEQFILKGLEKKSRARVRGNGEGTGAKGLTVDPRNLSPTPR